MPRRREAARPAAPPVPPPTYPFRTLAHASALDQTAGVRCRARRYSSAYERTRETAPPWPRPPDPAAPAARTGDDRSDDADLLRRSPRFVEALRRLPGADRLRRQAPRRLHVRRREAGVCEVPDSLLRQDHAREGARGDAVRGPADDLAPSVACAHARGRQALRRSTEAARGDAGVDLKPSGRRETRPRCAGRAGPSARPEPGNPGGSSERAPLSG